MMTDQQVFDAWEEAFRGKIASYKDKGYTLFASSSFQTQSVPLLHLISRVDPEIPVYFLDTGFLFAETHAFRKELTSLLGLKQVISIRSPIPHSQQRDKRGQFYYGSDPDYCCHMNKVLPMDEVLKTHDVWINGVRADQSHVRKQFKEEEPSQHGAIRYHPMLQWTSKMVYDYVRQNQLPKHPLEEKGYMSIGCVPCTHSWADALGREGRWAGQSKTECGLHTELVKPK